MCKKKKVHKKKKVASPEGWWKQGWGCGGVERPPLLLPDLPGLWLLPSFGPTAGWSTLQCTHNTLLEFSSRVLISGSLGSTAGEHEAAHTHTHAHAADHPKRP